MKRQKQRKRNDESPSDSGPSRSEQEPPRKIKFNISGDNLACFLGENKSTRRRTARTPLRPRSQRTSLPKPPRPVPEQTEARRVAARNECQEIVQGSLNAILYEIEDKGLGCAWEEGPGWEEGPEQGGDSSIWSVFSVGSSFEKSFASTMDVQPGGGYFGNYAGNYYYGYGYRPYPESSSFLVSSTEIGSDPRTTVMIRNIPNKYTITDLASEIDSLLPNTYDFLYLPCDIKNQCNVGYGFINFLTTPFLAQFYQQFQGKRWARFKSQKICNITYARLQGLNNLIEHFENSKVQKDKKYRPIIREFASIEHLIKSQQLH